MNMLTSILIGVIALLCAVILGQHVQINKEQKAHAETKAAYAVERGKADKAHARSLFRAYETAQMQIDEIEKVKNHAQAQNAHLLSLYGPLVDSGKRLRVALKARIDTPARRKDDTPTVAAGSQATGPAVDLSADVPARLDEAAERIASFADASRTAGLACEAIHEVKNTEAPETVTPGTSGK